MTILATARNWFLSQKEKGLKSKLSIWMVFFGAFLAPVVSASGGESHITLAFFWIAIILLLAKLSSLIEKFGQPAVLGELIMGVILGNLALIGIDYFEAIKHDEIIKFLAELGVVLLLFQIGLESNIHEMKKVGWKAFIVAIVGVVTPFILGTYVLGPWLFSELSFNAHLFLGATLTATSVGITARVFKDLGTLKSKEAQIILGAAVIDDVIGLIILAVVTAIVTTGAVGVGVISWITAKAVLFLVGAIVVGQIAAPRLGKWFSRIHTGVGMKFTLAIAFCLIFAYAASLIGLAAIVGAFAAGLVLDAVHFKHFSDPEVCNHVKQALHDSDPAYKAKIEHVMDEHAEKHIEDLIEPLAGFVVPIFFVVTGMATNLAVLADISVLGIALVVTFVAVIGKVCAGLFAGKDVNRWMVGFGMVPRGEVGLIFASIGKNLGVVSDAVFSVIVIMVIVTTLMTPPILAMMMKTARK